MNTEYLLSDNRLIPKYWYLSTPALYGGANLFDLMNQKHIVLAGGSNKPTWYNFSSKPGALAGALGNVNSNTQLGPALNITMTKAYTVSFWINFTSNTITTFSGNNRDVIQSTKDRVYINTSDVLKIDIATSTSTYSPPANTWLHLTYCCSFLEASNINSLLYINGVLIDGGLRQSSGNSEIQGICSDSGNECYGYYDDIMIFDAFLTGPQVRSVYKSSFVRKYRYNLWQQIMSGDLASFLLGGQF